MKRFIPLFIGTSLFGCLEKDESIDIEVCWNGQTRLKLREHKRIGLFDDGDGNRLSPIIDSAFLNAEKKWGIDAIHVTVPEIEAVASECRKHGFICENPKLPCNSQSGSMPVWFIKNPENVDVVCVMKSRYGRSKTMETGCAH